MEEREGSTVRSSELETRLSSSDKLVEMEVDTTISKPSSSKTLSSKPSSSSKATTFHALKESCNLDEEMLFRFMGTRICLPQGKMKKLMPLQTTKYVFMRLCFLVALDFPSIPS